MAGTGDWTSQDQANLDAFLDNAIGDLRRTQQEQNTLTNSLEQQQRTLRSNAQENRNYEKAQWRLQKATVALTVAYQSFKKVLEMSKEAASYEANMRRVAFILKESSAELFNWQETVGKSMGISKKDFADMAGTFSNLNRSFTDDVKTNANITKELINQAAMLSEKQGRTIEDVNRRIRSGILGSNEAIEDLGINVLVSSLKTTKAFKKIAGDTPWKSLSFEAQSYIRTLAIIEQAQEQTNNSMEKTSNLTLNKLAAEFSDAGTLIGQAFLNVIDEIEPILYSIAGGVKILAQAFKSLTGGDREIDDTIKVSKKYEDTSKGVKDSINDQEDAVNNLNKALKAGIQSFDELNLVNKDTSGMVSGLTDEQRKAAEELTIEFTIKRKPAGPADYVDEIIPEMESRHKAVMGWYDENKHEATLSDIFSVEYWKEEFNKIWINTKTGALEFWDRLKKWWKNGIKYALFGIEPESEKEKLELGISSKYKPPSFLNEEENLNLKKTTEYNLQTSKDFDWSKVSDGLKTGLKKAGEIALSGLSPAMIDFGKMFNIGEPSGDILNDLSKSFDKISKESENGAKGVKKKITEQWDDTNTQTKTWWDTIGVTIEDSLDNSEGPTKKAAERLRESVSKKWENANINADYWWGTVGKTLIKKLDDTEKPAKVSANKVREGVSQKWKDANTNAETWWQTVYLTVKNAIDAIGTISWSEVQKSFDTAWDTITDSIQAAIDKIKEFLGLQSEKDKLLSTSGENILDKTNIDKAKESMDKLKASTSSSRSSTPLTSSQIVEKYKDIKLEFDKPSTIKSSEPEKYVSELSKGISANAVDIPGTGGFKLPEKLSSLSEYEQRYNAQQSYKKFADGGIVTKPTFGLIGEAGSNEAVIPLNESGLEPLINGIGNSVLQALQQSGILEQRGQQDTVINIQLDGETLSKATSKYNTRETKRRNNSFVSVR